MAHCFEIKIVIFIFKKYKHNFKNKVKIIFIQEKFLVKVKIYIQNNLTIA